MGSVSFLAPWLLIGTLFAAVPIIIHLLNRSRFKVEPWGAMMFLQAATRVRAQRIKIQQLILLLLRALFFVLLGLALARPVTGIPESEETEAGDNAEYPTTHVIIFDASYSMRQGEGEDNAFHKAREAATRIVDSMGEADNMMIIWGSDKPKPMFPKPSFDEVFLREQVQGLEPGVTDMAIARALEQAYWVLEESTLPHHRIYILTDGQVHGWNFDEKEPWDKIVQHQELLSVAPFTYVLHQMPEDPVINIAVQRIYPQSPIVDIFRPTKFLVELGNYGTSEKDVDVVFRVNGEVVDDRTVKVQPGVHTVDFDHKFEESGSHHVTVLITGDDLDFDNESFLATEVLEHIPVLVIEGETSDNPWDSDGLMLKYALTAGAADENDPTLFDVTLRNQLDLEDIDTIELAKYSAVILTNVSLLSRHTQFALEQFVERGGGLLIALGDEIEPADYNRLYNEGEGLLPGVIQAVRTYDEDYFRPQFKAGQADNVLDIFDLSRTRVLRSVRVEKYWECKPADTAIRVGLFGDQPFILSKSYGEGNVALWTTSINADWTNFPTVPDYLPLVQNVMTHLAGSIDTPLNLVQGETLVFATDLNEIAEHQESLRDALTPKTHPDAETPGETGSDPTTDSQGENTPQDAESESVEKAKITTPDGEEHEVDMEFIGNQWVAQWTETQDPGIYTVEAFDLPPRYYAVPIRFDEANLKQLNDENHETADELAVEQFVETYEELEQAIKEETGAREWWQAIVFATLALLCTELFLGWKFS